MFYIQINLSTTFLILAVSGGNCKKIGDSDQLLFTVHGRKIISVIAGEREMFRWVRIQRYFPVVGVSIFQIKIVFFL
jgi:hypothetical protein